MSVVAIKHETSLKVMECATCGIPFAMPQSLYDKCYKEGGFWHCPAGHGRGWSNGHDAHEKAQDKAKLAEANRLLELAQKKVQWAEQDAANSKRETKALKGKLTKLANRAKAGICPCCNRTFKQLAAHMANKHPDFTETA